MPEITTFQYKKDSLEAILSYHYGKNWPIVYILNGQSEAYIGETTSAYKRAQQHVKNKARTNLNSMLIIADDEFNKSATLDIESMLIKYFAGDGKYLLQNANTGISNSDYYDRERYKAKFEVIWQELKVKGIVEHELNVIENSDLFKYSPYKALTDDQMSLTQEIAEKIKASQQISYLINGEPGTGKTIVATYLSKLIISSKWGKNLKIGLVVPMTSLRRTLKKVFKYVKGLSSSMILGPNEVVGKRYDVLLVDEAHRLQRRKNLTSYVPFDNANRYYNLGNDGTQLDWIMRASKSQILFYDPKQSIKPSDVRPENFNKYPFVSRKLFSQMRVLGGDDYIEYIHSILDGTVNNLNIFSNYEFRYFDRIADMLNALRSKNEQHELCRLLAGYAWKWQTNKDKTADYDIEIENTKLKWNSVNQDWVNSRDALNEVGCIHTIQGYDLNYAGVILGPEISYDFLKKKIVVDNSKYFDFNGRRALTDQLELEIYIKNIYKTLLTRGIKGTFVYACDEHMRKYLKQFIVNSNE